MDALKITEHSDCASEEKLTILKFANKAVPRLMWWAVIPAIFIALKQAGIALSSLATSASFVERLSAFWLVVPDHLKQVQKVNSDVDANNLGFFYLAMLLFAVVAAIRMVILYVRRRECVQHGDFDAAFVVFWFVGAIFFSAFDTVKDKPDLIYDFYVDAFGLYSFREAFFPYAVCMALGTSIMLIGTAINRSRTANSST